MCGFASPHKPNCLRWPGMSVLPSPGTANLGNSTHPCSAQGDRADGAPEPKEQESETANTSQKRGMQRHRPRLAEKGKMSQRTKRSILFPLQKMMILCTDSKMCQCCWSVLLKTLYFQSTLQMQHGSKALYIITHIPKVHLLCGGRDAQEQVLKSLNGPKLASTM